MILVLFLFKQKTAYDMRISDWISDVFSSDLTSSPTAPPSPSQSPPRKDRSTTGHINTTITVTTSAAREPLNHTVAALTAATPSQNQCHFASMRDQMNGIRSEEHTSELQSLMRISYAVFCLKKKNLDKLTSHNPSQYYITSSTKIRHDT